MADKIKNNNLNGVVGGMSPTIGGSSTYFPAYQIVSGCEGYDSIKYLDKCNDFDSAKTTAYNKAKEMLNKSKTYIFVNYYVFKEECGKKNKVFEDSVSR